MSAILNGTLRICGQKIENSGIKLKISPFDPGLEVSGSEVLLSQVLLNLLMNSQQAISSFLDKWITIDVEEVPGGVNISVTDSGLGIPPAIASKIFQPFFTTKPIGEGTGLGLSISYGIVGQLKGRLFVDAASVNTRFVISLSRPVTQIGPSLASA